MKYYDPEYGRVVDEQEVRRQYEWFRKNCEWYKKSFEKFAEENFILASECDTDALQDKFNENIAMTFGEWM